MTLQLRHIFFTDACTFMVLSCCAPVRAVTPAPGLLRAENDPRPCQIIRRQFHRHLVARQDADIVHAHLARDMSQHYVAIFQLHPEGGVGEIFHNLPLHLDNVFFRHQRVGKPAPLKLAFFNRLSYWCDMMYACTCDMKSMVTTTMINSDVPPK